MIKRVNLIEKQVLSLSYYVITQAAAVVLLIVTLTYGYHFFFFKKYGPELEEQKQRLSDLQAERDSLLAAPVKKKVDIGELQSLLDRLDSVPLWSKVMREISWSLPNSVWMTSFKATSGGGAPAAAAGGGKKKKKNTEKNKPEKKVKSKKAKTLGFQVSGLSADVKGIAEFITKLEKSAVFRGIQLNNSKKATFGYQFSISGVILLDYAR